MKTIFLISALFVSVFCAASASAAEISKKVDSALGGKLVAIARGHPNDLPEPPAKNSEETFLIYQLLGKHSGTAGWYAVNPWTGDVWDIMGSCERLSNSDLRREQDKIKAQFSNDEMKEYHRLDKLRPMRISDLKPCDLQQ